jgi:DNA-binding NarL/FixJ family response regulator
MKKKINVMIADDQTLFRQGMVVALGNYEEIGLITEATNGQDLLKKFKISEPDVVLLDLNMPVLSGMATMPIIAQDHPEVKVIVVSMYKEVEFITKLVKEGASGYLLKDSDITEVIKAISIVASGKQYHSELVADALVQYTREKRNSSVVLEYGIELTLQEKNLLRNLVSQNSNKQIADKMNLSVRTVEFYRSRLMQKLGVLNTAGLVAYAMKHFASELI